MPLSRNSLFLCLLLPLALLLITTAVATAEREFSLSDRLLATVGLSGDQYLTGLPEGFEPTVGYYSQFGLVGLWDEDGHYYIAEDGREFRAVQAVELGLPSDFTPTVGYSHQLHGEPIVGLWQAKIYYIWAEPQGLQRVRLYDNYSEISYSFTPVLGYWHGYGDGLVSLWDEAGYNYLWNSQTDDFSVLTPDDISDLGLPRGQAPVVGYYHDSAIGGQEAVNLWYEGGEYYRLDGNDLIDSSTSGLPSGTPDTGYWDEINNQIILWYGEEMYSSSNGVDFELLYPRPAEEITPSVSLSAEPQEVPTGRSTTLSWESEEAESCTGTNFDTQDATRGTTETDSLDADTTFTLECESQTGHQAEDQVTVTVTEPESKPSVEDLHYTGLPQGLKPTAGYHSQFGYSALWSQYGSYYVAEDRENYHQRDPKDLGLPADFTPVTGYSHQLSGEPMEGLWGDQGRYFVRTAQEEDFHQIDLSQRYPNFPSGISIVTGYWHDYGDGFVSLWDEAGYNYLWNSQTDNFEVLTPPEISNLGLPRGEAPQAGYYFEETLAGDRGLHLWYENGRMYRTTDGSTFRQSSLSGLPGTPDVAMLIPQDDRIEG